LVYIIINVCVFLIADCDKLRTLELDDAGSGSVVEWSSSILEVTPEGYKVYTSLVGLNVRYRTTCDFNSWKLRGSLFVGVFVSDRIC